MSIAIRVFFGTDRIPADRRPCVRLGVSIRDHNEMPVFICLSLRRFRRPVKQPPAGLGLHYPEGMRSLLTPLIRVFDVPACAVNNQACAGVNCYWN